MKHKIILILSSLLLYNAFKLKAQMPDSVKTYIDSAFYFMQTKSLFAKDIDWIAIKDSSMSKAKLARNYKDAFPAIAYAFKQLKDYHGMFTNFDTTYRYPVPVNFEKILSPGLKKEMLKGPRIVTSLLNSSIAYLRVPTMIVNRQDEIDKRANMLRDSLCSLLSKNPRGLIIDLRLNNGGNSAPMVSGLGPLFQSDLLGYGVDRDGKFLSPTVLKDGILLDDEGTKMVTTKNTCSANGTMPIAVLIGKSTVSSGEILAAFLKQQSNVELFGESTPGFCDATEGFLFGNEEGYLLLSVNRIADAKKHIYEDLFVQPSVYIKSQDNYDELAADPTVKAALRWLRSKVQ